MLGGRGLVKRRWMRNKRFRPISPRKELRGGLQGGQCGRELLFVEHQAERAADGAVARAYSFARVRPCCFWYLPFLSA